MPVEVVLKDYTGTRTVVVPDEFFLGYPKVNRFENQNAYMDKIKGQPLGDILAHVMSLVQEFGNEAILDFDISGNGDDGYEIDAYAGWYREETDQEYHHRVARFYEQQERTRRATEAQVRTAEAVERQMYEKLKAKYGDKV